MSKDTKPSKALVKTDVSGSVTIADLRVGNWVFVDNMLNNHIISQIRIDKVSVDYIRLDTNNPHQSIVDIDRLRGIELNDFCLNNLGFKQRLYFEDWFVKIPNTGTILIYENGKMAICAENHSPALYVVCKYAHTIQNIFHSLTGRELTDR